MPGERRVVARIKGSSGSNFPNLAHALFSLIADGGMTPEDAAKMMESIIYASITTDPEGWYEPRGELAVHPLVFEALNKVRFQLMEEEAYA